MELWERDYLDLEVPAFLRFRADRSGEFQFGAVRGWIDYRVTDRDGAKAVEFSWEGESEGDALYGRGWASLERGRLVGRLFIHNGDDSSFVAERMRRGPGVRRRRLGGA